MPKAIQPQSVLLLSLSSVLAATAAPAAAAPAGEIPVVEVDVVADTWTVASWTTVSVCVTVSAGVSTGAGDATGTAASSVVVGAADASLAATVRVACVPVADVAAERAAPLLPQPDSANAPRTLRAAVASAVRT
jgi:hypothetical protein